MKIYFLAAFILLAGCTLVQNDDSYEPSGSGTPSASLQPSSDTSASRPALQSSPQSTPQSSAQPITEGEQAARSLLEAASSNHFDVVEAIIEESEIKELDELLKYVLTYWHQYSYKNQEDLQLVSLLLEKGADPNGVDDDGTPLLFIARTADMLKVLAEDERADLNVISPHGSTLLLSAIGSYNSEKVDYLLQRGADPNDEGIPNDQEKWSPLHLAVAFSDRVEWVMPIVESLLNHKDIDLTKVDEENRTPYELAVELEKYEAMELFEKKGLGNPAE